MPNVNEEKLRNLSADFNKGEKNISLRDKYCLGNRALQKYILRAYQLDLINDAALARLVFDKTIGEFPHNPENRLNAILSSFNSEVKQAAFLMLGNKPITPCRLQTQLEKITTPAIPSPKTFQNYFAKTFMPIGFLVHMEIGVNEEVATDHYHVNYAGEKYGLPICAYSLKYAVDNQISLASLLGPTTSAGDSRAPYNRARIVELVPKGYDTISKLSHKLGICSHNVKEHLKALQSLDIVIYDIFDHRDKEGKKYTWNRKKTTKNIEVIGGSKPLTDLVTNWFKDHIQGTVQQIAQDIQRDDPTSVSPIVSGLVKQGFVTASFPSTSCSIISLYDNSPLMENYISSIRNALEDGDQLKIMQKIAEEFDSDTPLFQDYLNQGISRYMAHSPYVNSLGLQTRNAQIIDYISDYQNENGDWPTRIEIVNGLECLNGSLTLNFNYLVNKGILSKHPDGTNVRYSLK